MHNLTLRSRAKLYANLRQQVAKAGILKRSYGYYWTMFVIIFSGFFLSLYMVIVLPISFLLALWAVALGFLATQISGFLHDAGHRAIFKSVRMNDILGFIAGGILATDFPSWKFRHNLHHAHPNQEEVDPDIIDSPVISFTRQQFLSKKGIWRKLSAYQVYFYYPMVFLYNFGLRFYGIGYWKRRILSKKTIWQTALYSLGIFLWFILPFIVFPLGKAILVFVIVNLVMSLYLMNIIAPNHKAMPKMAKNVKLSFLERQIITSSNVYGNWLNDFLYMGLNYQIEHHLFPNCPRNKLKYIQPYVLDICKKLRLEYTQVSFIQSNKNILAELRQLAAP